MGYGQQMQITGVLLSILGLLLVGGLIALGSGVGDISSRRGIGRFFGNLSRVLICIFAYLIGLLAVQHLIGFPLELGW
jgi:hypothetical protein